MDNESNLESSVVTQKPKQGSLYTVFKYVSIGTGILGIGFLIALGGFLLAQNNQKTKTSEAVIQNQTSTPVAVTPLVKDLTSTIADTGVASQKLYTNPKVGISFKFSTLPFGDDVMDVKEVGNKIYYYDTKYVYTQGQYIEVFQKDSTDTLDIAIQKQFLGNISPKDCFVKDAGANIQANFPSSYVLKIIGFPVDQNSDTPAFAQSNKCPTPYTESNGIAYFLGDTKHPKTFLFLSIGQQSFPVEKNSRTGWQDTIKFLD